MSAFEIVDAVNSPGNPGKTGDDRYGYDEGAGTAWVLDGATDATPLQPFPGAESGAAWFADTLSSHLIGHAPKEGEAPEVYFRRILEQVRARAESESDTPLDSLPPAAWPIASGIWLRRLGDVAELCWLGDCMALDLISGEEYGPVGASEQESEDNREVLKRSEEEIWNAVREAREAAFEAEKPIFSLRPHVITRLNRVSIPATARTQILLMSDGFYRLIHPYGLYDGPGLASAVRTCGLGDLVTQLRRHESGLSRQAIGRVKRADDACALWLSFD